MTSAIVKRISYRVRRQWNNSRTDWMISTLIQQVKQNSPAAEGAPVFIFNASTRLRGISLNAAFSFLTGLSLKLGGVPVIHLACKAGLSRCVLGTNKNDPQQEPPCQECLYQSSVLYQESDVFWFEYKADAGLECSLDELSLGELQNLVYQDVPLGELVLPTLRWVLRRHHLKNNEATLYLYRQYILSAWSIARNFKELLALKTPRAVLVFNGMFFPEAVVRWIAQNQEKNLPVITHEVGLMPFTGYFTTGEATAYPIDIPDDFVMSSEQDQLLDDYLSQRFKGNFSMAGVRFWPEMSKIEPEFWEKAASFKQIVPVFTNVVFDTSQGHANVVFPHMFAWLDTLLEIIKAHPETYFVIRAHPDETRPGKASRESVADWVIKNGVEELKNVCFVSSDEYFSSYELIQHSKFVLIYNSTIGLEASLLGAAVLSGGKARFTQVPTVFMPGTIEEFVQKTEEFLLAEKIEVPQEFKQNARRFLYYQIFRTSLPFDHFLKDDGIWNGYVSLQDFSWSDLLPDNSPTMQVILDGILNGKPFLKQE